MANSVAERSLSHNSSSSLRKRLLVDEWVVIAPDRAARPRQLELSPSSSDDFCPFCPDNAQVTPPTIETWDSPVFPDAPWGVRAVANKFPALRVEPELSTEPDGLYESISGVGAHEVLIEAPEHHTRWRALPAEHLAIVLGAWQDRMADLRRDKRLRSVLAFKNHGARAGATLGHIHSQLIGLPLVPTRLRRELDGARDYFQNTGLCAICEMIARERSTGDRLILENEAAVAIAPFGSRTAFETWILPRSHRGDYLSSPRSELLSIAEITTTVLDLWRRALGEVAYNLILHCLPFDLLGEPYYHWHLEMLPRTGQVAGFEWGSNMYINATPSEVAARHLRKLADHSA